MRRTIVMTGAIALLGLVPAAAAATTTDSASDHAALTAYDQYLHNVVSSVPAWRRDNEAFVASVSTGCGHVLAGLSRAPSGTVDQTALFNFGVEIGGDLAVVGAKADRAPLAKLTRAVAPLPWSNPESAPIVRRFAAAQRRSRDHTQLIECLRRPPGLSVGVVVASRSGENLGELDPRDGALVGHAAPRIERHRVLECTACPR